MKIAAILVIHDHAAVVKDTVESIRRYMTKDILTVVDPISQFRRIRTKNRIVGSVCDVWSGHSDRFSGANIPAHRLDGLKHNHHRAPYRNMMFGLQKASEMWEADWYCYLDYDALVVSEAFRERLETDAWILGNDHRVGNLKFPIVEAAAGVKIHESHYLLGCCHFIHRDFIRLLNERDFFGKFLWYTNDFKDGFMPGHTVQSCHDAGEHILPSLAVAMGGKVQELGCYSWDGRWIGDPRFQMRFRPDICPAEHIPEASILHPLKDFSGPIRTQQREKRNEL